MKSILKNKLVYGVMFFLLACILFFAGLSLNEKKPTLTADAAMGHSFTFEGGAAIRIDTSEAKTSGIRFTANFGQDIYDAVVENEEIKENAELGMIIVPDSYIKAYEESGYTDYFRYFKEVKGKEKADISTQFGVDKILTKNGKYQIRGALVKVLEANYARDFRAVAYYTVNGGLSYHYTANEDARSVIYVAKKATQDTSVSYSSAQKTVLNGYVSYSQGQPMTIFDMSESATAEKFGTHYVHNGNEAIYWKGALETGKERDGVSVARLATTASTGLGHLRMSYDLTGVDLSSYDIVKFSIYNGMSAVKQFSLWGSSGSVGAVSLASNQWTELTYTVEQFQAGKYLNIQEGCYTNHNYYITDFIAYKEMDVSFQIDALPYVDGVTLADKAAIEAARAAYDALDDKSTVSAYRLEKLEALENALAAYTPVIFDMSKAETANKFIYPFDNGIYGWKGTITTGATHYGKPAAEISITEMPYTQPFVYFTHDSTTVDLSEYEYVTYSIYNTSTNQKTFRTKTVGGDGGSVIVPATTLTPQAWTTFTVSVEDFQKGAYFCIWEMYANNKIYISDIIAFGESQVAAKINALPAASAVTEEDRAAVEDARTFYDLLYAKNSSTTVDIEKLTACEEALENLGAPAEVIFDMSKTETAAKFTINNTAVSGYEWKGEITSGETFNGKYALKLDVQENVDNQNQIYVQYALGMDVSAYQYVTFAIYSPYSNLVRLATGQEANRVAIGQSVANTWTQITVDASTFASKGYFNIVTAQNSGYAVYLSDIIAFSAASVQPTINALPAASEVTAAHANEIANARMLVTALTGVDATAANALNLAKLTAAENALNTLGGLDVKNMIDSLPAASEVTREHEEVIAYVRAEYDALAEAEKVGVTNYQKLVDCETTLTSLPLLVFDMSDSATATKFPVGGSCDSYTWTGSVTSNVEFDGVKALKIDATPTSSAQFDIKPDFSGIDLTGYDYVTFSVYGTKASRLAFITAGFGSSYATRFSLDRNVWKEITVPVSVLTQYGWWHFIVAEANVASQVYISDIIAFSAASVQLTINDLPAASEITSAHADEIANVRAWVAALESVNATAASNLDLTKLTAAEEALENLKVDDVEALIAALPEASEISHEHESVLAEVRAAYDELTLTQQGSVENQQKLFDCEYTFANLPLLVFDMSDSATATKFPVGGSCNSYTWTGSVTSNVELDGVKALKIDATPTSSAQFDIKPDFSSIDLTGYDYVTFSVYGTKASRLAFITAGFGSSYATKFSLDRNVWNEITVPVSVLTQYGWWHFIVAEVNVASQVYISDVVAHSAKTVQCAIDNLPAASEITSADAFKVEEVRALYDGLSDEAKLEVAEARLLECEEALPYVVFDATKTVAENDFTRDTTSYSPWSGDINEGVVIAGKKAWQIYATVSGTGANSATLRYTLAADALVDYETVKFSVYTQASGVSFRFHNGSEWQIPQTSITAGEWKEFSVSAASFADGKSHAFNFIIPQNATTVVYLSEVVAYEGAVVEQTDFTSYAWSAPGVSSNISVDGWDMTQAYKDYADAGFNTVYLYGESGYSDNGTTSAWGNTSVIEAATAAGINRFVVQNSMIDGILNRGTFLPNGSLIGSGSGTSSGGTTISQFADEAALDYQVKYYIDRMLANTQAELNIVGIALIDEPSIGLATATGQMYRSIKRVYPNMEIILNLLPGADGTGEGTLGEESANNRFVGDKYTTIKGERARYEHYIKTFFEETGADRLSVDMYPFVNESSWGGLINDDKFEYNYYMTLQVLAKYCKLYGAELSFVLQSTQNGSAFSAVTQEQMRLQMNSILGFGAVDYSFFTYVGDHDQSFVNASGEKNANYTYAQNVMKEASSLYSLLKDYRYQASQVISTDTDYTDNVENGTFKKVTSVTATGTATLATELINSNGDCVYMVQNVYNASGNSTVTLTLDSSVTSITVYTLSGNGGSYTASTVEVSGSHAVTLAQGSAAYIVINK